MTKLEGKVAWVTGGATGMGRAAALQLAQAGASIAIGSLTEELRTGVVVEGQMALTPSHDQMTQTAATIEACGVKVFAAPLNVASLESVEESYEKIVGELGPIDILANAAGTSGRHTMVGHPDELWHALLNVNLNGAYRTTKHCLPGMMDRGWGRIINFSSTAGLVGGDLHAAYCSAKTALLGLTRCVALEGAPKGVTCNAICPGWVATDQNYFGCEQEIVLVGLSGTSVAEYRAMMAQKWVPQKQFLDAEEPGRYVAYLCSDEALGITGQALRISGGSTW